MTDIDATARMRCTAALLSCTSTVSARLVHDDHVALEVMRPPHPSGDHAVVPPCWFRAMLANGSPTGPVERSRFERLTACRIELGVRAGTTLLPGNVLRVDAGSSWMHLHAVPSGIETVAPIVAAASDQDLTDTAPLLELHAVHDLDVTIVGLASARSDAASEIAADDLRTVSMRVTIDRLERGLHAIADHPAGGLDDAPVLRHPDR